MSEVGGDVVVVLVRDACHLCVEALATIAEVCARAGVSWRSVDVDGDPRLRAEYTDHVPVTFVAGVVHARWFVDPAALSAAIDAVR
ncbi:MAG: glutaredoxin family protein [Propionicimonas sp.]